MIRFGCCGTPISSTARRPSICMRWRSCLGWRTRKCRRRNLHKMKRRDLASPDRAQGLPGPWEQRGALLLASAALFVFVFFLYAGRTKSIEALYRLLTDGVFVLVWLAAMAGAGVWLVRLFRLDDGPAGFATLAALGIGFVSLVTLG